MSQPILVVIILLAIAGAVALYVLHRRSSATAKTVSSLGARMDNAATKVENVAAKVAAVPSLVAQHVDAAFKAKARPIVATTAEPVPAPAPAPAAPAASETVAPPPAIVAPAAPPAAPAPSAGGGGTEPSLTIEPRAPIPDSTGPVPVASLSLADLRFLWWATINPATPKMHNWEYTVLSGTRAQIQEDLATVGLNVSWLRAFDPTAYHGILRNYYDEAVKA